HRAEPLLPGDLRAERGETKGNKRILAHVRSDSDRPIRVEPHEQRAEHGGQDRGYCGRFARDLGEFEDGWIDDDDIGHGDECGHAAEHFGPDCRSALAQAKEALQHARAALLHAIQSRSPDDMESPSFPRLGSRIIVPWQSSAGLSVSRRTRRIWHPTCTYPFLP